MKKPLVKDMSQWSNRFQVLPVDTIPLSDEDDSLPPDDSSLYQPETQTMSETSSPAPEQALPYPKIYIRNARSRLSTQISVQLKTLDTDVKMAVSALLDSGATGSFLDTEFIKDMNINTRKLPRAIPVYNVDGTLNQGGSIQEEVDLVLNFGDHTEIATFAVCGLGEKVAIIGHDWLFHHNPEINWQTGDIKLSRCPSTCKVQLKEEKKERKKERKRQKAEERRKSLPKLLHDDEEEQEESHWEEGDRLFVAMLRSEPTSQVQINASQNMSQKLAEEALKGLQQKSFEEIVPECYHEFKDVFSKESFDELPPEKPWDHVIELKPGSEPHSSKIYPMSLNEQAELDKFLAENLNSGRIRPSKSPMASPVFFIKKKDGSLRLVQDCRKLNDMTVKNSYPLPLMRDIITRLRKAKMFTKLDGR